MKRRTRRRLRRAALLLGLVAVGGVILRSRRPVPFREPLDRITTIEPPQRSVVAFTREVLVPRLDGELEAKQGVIATPNVRFTFFDRLGDAEKAELFSQTELAEDRLQSYLGAWRPKLSGATIKLEPERASFVTSDGQTVLVRSAEIERIVVAALYDTGVGVRVKAAQKEHGIYLVPTSRSNLQTYRVGTNGKMDRASLQAMCDAIEAAPDPRVLEATASALVGGIDPTFLASLSVDGQLAVLSGFGVAAGDCFRRVRASTKDPRGVICGSHYFLFMFLGYTTRRGRVFDRGAHPPVLRPASCHFFASNPGQFEPTRLLLSELFSRHEKARHAALWSEINAVSGGPGNDLLSELLLAVEGGRVDGRRARELTTRMFEDLTGDAAEIDTWIESQRPREE